MPLHRLPDAIGLAPDTNHPKMWRSGRTYFGSGGVLNPDYAHRLAFRRNKLGGRPSGVARVVMPPNVAYEESYRWYMRKQGYNSQSALAEAQREAANHQRMLTGVKEAGMRITGMLPNAPTYAGLMPDQSIPGDTPMATNNSNQYFSTSGLVHPYAPTLNNAHAAGLTSGPTQGPMATPRGVMSSGTGTSSHQIHQARLHTTQARQNMQLPVVHQAGTPSPNQSMPIMRSYQSVDGNVYTVHTQNEDRYGNRTSVQGGATSIILHALAEIVKGGDPLLPLGACIGAFYDKQGQEQGGELVVHFRELLEAKYPTPEQAAKAAEQGEGDPDMEEPAGINYVVD